MKIPFLAIPHSGLFFSPDTFSQSAVRSSAQAPSQCFVSLKQAYKNAGLKNLHRRPKNIFECEKKLENFYRGEITKNPKQARPYYDLGNYYIARKNYLSATVYLEAAHQQETSNPKFLEQLGKAYYALGNFEKARKAYGDALLIHSRNPTLLQLHTEASQAYLDNAKGLTSDQVEQLHHEIAADHALGLALKIGSEKNKLKEIKAQLNQLKRTPKDQALQIVTMVLQSALLYLQLSEIKFPNPKDSTLVQKEIRPLALELLETLSQKSKGHQHVEVQNLGKLFAAYIPYLQGNDELAKQRLSSISQIPEAQLLLKLLENKKLRAKNLAALSIWEAYIKDGRRIETDKFKSLFFLGVVDPIQELAGQPTTLQKAHETWNLHLKVLNKVKILLLEGVVASIQEGLEKLTRDESQSIRQLAASLLKESEYTYHPSGNILSNLIHVVGKEIAEERATDHLLRSAVELERHFGSAATSIGIYAFLKNNAAEEAYRAEAAQLLEKAKAGKDFVDHLKDGILTTDTLDLATDLMIFKTAWKASNWAKNGMMKLFKNKLGWNHLLWTIVARSVAVWSEVGTIWGLSLLRDAFKFNPAKVFEYEKMLQRFVFLSLTVRGIKTMGAIGVAFSPSLAKLFKMISKDGTKLTPGGMFLSWSILHTSAFLGFVGVDIGMQKLGGITPPGIIGIDWMLKSANRFFKPLPGGAKESIAKNMLLYLKYAFAARTVSKALGPKSYASQLKSFQEVLRIEAEASVERHIEKSGFQVIARDQLGHPVFGKAVPKNRKVAEPSTPTPAVTWVKDFYHQAISFQLTRPGYSSGKMLKILRSQGANAAQAYLKQFGLKLVGTKDGELILRDVTLHEQIGISSIEPIILPQNPPKPTQLKVKTDQKAAVSPP